MFDQKNQLTQLQNIQSIDQIEDTFDSFDELNNLDLQVGVEDMDSSKHKDKIRKAIEEDQKKEATKVPPKPKEL